jgi:RNA-directed DNA polymerase
MGVERRGRVICGWFVWSTGATVPWEELWEQAEVVSQAVCDFQTGGLGGIRASQGEQRRTGSRRGHAGAIREGSEAQPVQDLEPDGFGQLRPAPVAAVEIPKPHGDGTRILGVPTIADRIAQTVVARRLEGKVEPIFHPDAYGYRPGRSALDAVAVCRRRCWRYDWVIDLDVQKFFDSVPWDLVIKAVTAHINTEERWVVLYVKWWLAAPIQQPDGTVQQRDRGTPQGSAVSPVLANLFLHYAFDAWMAREFPTVPFERYADDAVVHCVSQRQAAYVRRAVTSRMERVGLRLHPDKTQIVYCKDDNRPDAASQASTSFTFLGYTFRARTARDRNGRRLSRSCPRSARTP